jgi:hypothetical protein
MKSIRKFLVGSLMLIGLPFVWYGCVGPGGGGSVVVYGDGPSWFGGGGWLDGGGRGSYADRGGAGRSSYVHPSAGGGHSSAASHGSGRGKTR